MLIRFLFWLFLLSTFQNGHASKHIDLATFDYKKRINSYASYHIERDKTLNIAEVHNSFRQFTPIENEILNFGYFINSLWLKVDVKAQKEEELLIELNPFWIDTVQLFSLYKNRIIFQSKYTGLDFKDKKIKVRQSFPYFDEYTCNYLIPFKVDSGMNSVYIRLSSTYSAKRLSLKFWQKEKFSNRELPFSELLSTRYIILGIAIFAMLLGFSLGIVLNQKIFALYALFLLTNILNLFAVKGWIYPYVDFFQFYPYDFKGLLNGLMLLATLLYFYHLIPLHYANQKIRKLIFMNIFAGLFLLIMALLLPPYTWIYKMLAYTFKPIFFIAVPLALLYFLDAAKQGYKMAWVYFISIVPWGINAFLHLLQISNLMGVLHNNYLWEFSVFFELTLYSFAMIYSFRRAMNEKRKAEFLLEQNRQQFVHNLYKMQDLERIRFARDLHDSIGQKLSVVKMYLSDSGSEKVNNFLDEAISEVRVISHNLIPEELNFGIKRALNELAEKINLANKIRVTLKVEPDNLKLSKEIELSVYRIIQEILNNMVKHAQASQIDIRLESKNNLLIISVNDNGQGFDTKIIERSSGIGWQNIYARTKVLNGIIDIKSEINKGTKIKITIPV
jgi:signal transduction histidine kinase